MATKVTELSSEDLAARYETQGVKYAEATEAASASTANRHYAQCVNYYQELRHRGPEDVGRLAKYMQHESPWLSLLTATMMLEFQRRAAARRIKQLIREGGPVAFDARITLWMWRLRRLKFPIT